MRKYDFRWAGLNVAWLAIFGCVSVAAVVPLWCVTHPPLQDMPQHLAAIRVLKSYPDLNLGQYFELTLWRTQYLAYYLLAWLLSYPLGPVIANKLLLSVAIVALPCSIAYLLNALGRDSRAALFAFALTYNAHLILGFFNFIAALPLMFFGLASAVLLRRAPNRRREVALSVLLVVCFYMHVVPFALLAVGTASILASRDVRATFRRARVFVPAALVCACWLWVTPAGNATLSAAGISDDAPVSQHLPASASLREMPMWLTDVLHGDRDDELLVAWMLLVLSGLVFSENKPESDAADAHDDLSWRIVMLCPLSMLAYFITPISYDWIWPISARFPLLAALFGVFFLRVRRDRIADGLFVLVVALTLFGFVEITRAFSAFEHDEVGEIDEALKSIPEGERVAGLIFERGSAHVKFSPFIHYVALYQAQKGGAVMFTFADFPQSPFHFREDARPPRVPPRWEWMPERVDPTRDLGFYSYVLTRGGPGRIAQRPEFERIFSGPRYHVYRRR